MHGIATKIIQEFHFSTLYVDDINSIDDGVDELENLKKLANDFSDRGFGHAEIYHVSCFVEGIGSLFSVHIVFL